MGETNSGDRLNYLLLLSVFQFQKVERAMFFVIHSGLIGFYMTQKNFSHVSKFIEIEEEGSDFLGEPILQNG